tara:strand:- start:4664 stop:5038 length:375 start_codon:yes stop_codon:yes gene_type:complete
MDGELLIPQPLAPWNWSSNAQYIIAWIDPTNSSYIRFAIPANSINDYSIFQYSLNDGEKLNFGDPNTYIISSSKILHLGILYDGFIRSGQWTAGNYSYNQHIDIYNSGGEENAINVANYGGNKF